MLGMAVRSALDQADKMGLCSISIPAISSGIFGFPKPLCAVVLFDMSLVWIKERGELSKLKKIKFTNFDEETVSIFEKEMMKRKK